MCPVNASGQKHDFQRDGGMSNTTEDDNPNDITHAALTTSPCIITPCCYCCRRFCFDPCCCIGSESSHPEGIPTEVAYSRPPTAGQSKKKMKIAVASSCDDKTLAIWWQPTA